MRHDVYGIGNALVDMEFELSEEELKELALEKGVMTLVDEKRQTSLLEKASGTKHKRSCGGSAANTVIALAQLGGKAYYSCKVASDESGAFYLEDLEKEGVANVWSGRKREAGTTGKCMVFITPDGERTMETYLGISESLGVSELDYHQLAQAKYLYIEGYLVTSPTGRKAAMEAMAHARKNRVKVALTFSDPAMPKYFKSGLEEMIGDGVDLLFCNLEEALAYTHTENLDLALAELKKIAKMIVVTMGPQGARVIDPQGELMIPTTEVKAIDTNGAGDLFAGSFLWGMTQDLPLQKCGELACAAAGKLVTCFGARLKKQDLEAIKNKVLGAG